MTRLTPEQIAEIKARHEADWKAINAGGSYYLVNVPQIEQDRAALISHIESDGWQTMETAPRDGTPILGAYYNDIDWEYRLIAWNENLHPYPWQQLDQANEWSGDRVSYWRPLPAPPETKE